jgi:hypothetical protein
VLALSGVILVEADTRAPAATGPVLEVSTSCVAVNQDVQLTVWGSGFDGLVPSTIQWIWSQGNDPAVVSPPAQRVSTGTFALTFDFRGGPTPGFGRFEAILDTGRPVFVIVSIGQSCPNGSGTCTLVGNQPTLAVQVPDNPPPTQWDYSFYYQYHQPDQVGPVVGNPGLDGAAHGTFVGLPQNPASPTVTARIVNRDNGAQVFFITFSVPVCRAPPTTTPTTASPTTTPSTTTTTTVAPGLPSLTVNPKVGSDGTVAVVKGAGFPANVNVAVLWHRGLGAVTAHTDSTGAFIVSMLVFPHDLGGPRTVAASGFPSATAAFLVEAGPAGPPGIGSGQWLFRSNSAG